MSNNKDQPQEQPKKPRGRPKKAVVAAKKQGGRNAVGRPKGDAAIINEYKARMLASPKSRKVLETILNAALDDEHKHQSAAWKLVMDRMLPVSAFEKEVTGSNGKNAIQINITGVNDVSVGAPKEPVDGNDFLNGDFKEVNPND
jgi:hypothetical protein